MSLQEFPKANTEVGLEDSRDLHHWASHIQREDSTVAAATGFTTPFHFGKLALEAKAGYNLQLFTGFHPALTSFESILALTHRSPTY